MVAPIARGGMAEVWEGYDEVLSRPVAVKVLQAHLAADGVFLERFRREAVTAARLGHPGITATFDTGIDQGTAFIVMELVRGRNLRQLLADYGRLEPWQAVAVTRQVADALAYAHQAGLVHRDVKPANILLVEDELGSIRVKVTDFGIAKAGLESGGDLTRTGMVLGTPKYLSPEQIRGSDPDSRADLYSLGVVLYEMLVGEPPFVGENDMATALAHLNERVPKPSASVRGVPGGLDRVVTDLLAKSPARRIQSGAELRQRLDGLGSLAPPPPGRSGDGPRRTARRRHDGPRTPVPAAFSLPESQLPESQVVDGLGIPPGAGNGAGTSPTGATGSRFTPVPPPPPNRSLSRESASRAPGAAPTTSLAPPDPTRVRSATDQMGVAPASHRFRRSERTAGFVVLGLVIVGAVVAATLLSTSSNGRRSPASSLAPAVSGAGLRIVGVTVFMNNSRSPDNPDLTPSTFDGNPNTYWQTDHYTTPTFGNLYTGIGLQIQVASTSTLRTLTVSSPTTGWAASTYVSATSVANGQPIASWGPATDAKSAISGNATFSLGSRRGQYVLLWITNLGPDLVAKVGELTVG